ncbi:GH92 family glycosyl hydrolase [Streptomyces sp. CA-253872]|uniref:GH92 family glycosyl hydrolase n=1 Tax=Streptomyces sp. CA-253872 TaxID=3240067 RepID=UPI003D8CA1D7
MRTPRTSAREPAPPARRRGAGLLIAAVTSLGLLTASVPAAQAHTGHPAPGRAASAYDSVDPFIGTKLDTTQNKGNSAYGNTWPGAALPFGMVQSSPTTYRTSDGDQKGGYEYTADKLRGFGMTRLSGTGCEGRFSAFDFPVLPYAGALPDGGLPRSPAADITSYYLDYDHDAEEAAPGYYRAALGNGVTAELTATTRSAVSRYAFPRDGGSATLLLDVAGSNNAVYDSHVSVSGRTVSGWVEAASVCEGGGHYRAYFSTTFDKPFTAHGTWQGDDVTPGANSADGGDRKHGAGAWLTFPRGAKVTSHTGLSYVDVDGAARNVRAESAGHSFDAVRAEARRAWERNLGTVKVEGGTAAERTKFYTALYHAQLHPNVTDDVSGRYPGYDGKVRTVARGHHVYTTYSGWDTYRGQAQLLALLFPKIGDDVNQSLVDMVEQTGTWPNWPHLNQAQQKMTGDSLQAVLSAIDAFGSTHYDRAGALRSMVETQSLPATNTRRTAALQYFGAGFVENAKGDSATSKTLEYAIDDFAIAQLAGRLGQKETENRFMARAQNWRNVFDPVTQEIRPRSRNGFDRDFDLGQRGDQFDQATGYQYGWMVPQNIGGLIAARGGEAKVSAELDEHLSQLDAGVYGTKGAYLSNQPSFSAPYVYNWLRQPAKTGETLRRATSELYGTGPDGLPGNDDLGALSAWYVWANLGLSPTIYGTANLVLSAPLFDKVTIRSQDSTRTLRLNAPGTTGDRPYVRSLKVNGRTSTASWVGEDFARRGGTLDFTMAAKPGAWGTRAGDVPPSYDAGSDARNDVGTTADGAKSAGSLDLSDNSLSRERLAEAGAAPGAKIPLGDTGVTFTWPRTAPGEPDNWIPHGQRIAVGGRTGTAATGISFLGLATNGPAQGTARVEYTDGTTQDVPVALTDWTPGTDYRFGNVPLVETTGRNRADGTADTTRTVVFGTAPEALDPAKRVKSVVLPQSSDKGVLHLFDVSLTTKPLPTTGD